MSGSDQTLDLPMASAVATPPVPVTVVHARVAPPPIQQSLLGKQGDQYNIKYPSYDCSCYDVYGARLA